MATAAKQQAELYEQEMATCRAAMIDLAKQYDRQLGFWESRVTDAYRRLQNDETDSLELLGTTLDELRVAQKRVQSVAERLKQRGLRLLPSDYVLTHGESVVIVDGTWDGVEGTVVVQSTETTPKTPNDQLVEVSVSVSLVEPSQTVQLQRHQVAIWDYDSVFDDWEEGDWSVGTSREESKRRLSGILSTLSTTPTQSTKSRKETTTKSYISSRQRKAAGKKRKKR